MNVVGASDLIQLISEVCAQPDRCARMARRQGRESISLGHHGGKVRGQLLKVELLLVPELDHLAVRICVCEQRMRLIQEGVNGGVVLA